VAILASDDAKKHVATEPAKFRDERRARRRAHAHENFVEALEPAPALGFKALRILRMDV
jgi:hypothetical protein